MRPDKSATMTELVRRLAEGDLFREFAPAEVLLVAHYFHTVEFRRDGIIFQEGDPGAFMCILSTGKVTVLKRDQNWENVWIATLVAGRTFGEMAVLDGERRSATCMAATDCIVLTLSKESLDRMLDAVPATGAKVVRAVAVSLSRRLRMADGQLVDRRTNNAF